MTEVPARDDPVAAGAPVLILGGGLAGLSAALRITQLRGRGVDSGRGVTIVEGQKILGGKARSLPDVTGCHGTTVPWTDKGYHIFPHWYWDLWAVLADAGIVTEEDHRGCTEDHCVDMDDPSDLPGSSPFTCPFRAASKDYTIVKVHADGSVELSDTKFSARTFAKIVPMLLVMMGLVGADTERLDNRTLEDHLLRCWYAGDTTRERIREVVLKALANPAFDASALTTANTFRRWLPVYLEANWRATRGPLQSELINPIVEVLEQRSVTFELAADIGCIEVESNRVTCVEVDGVRRSTSSSKVIAALPHPVLAEKVAWVSASRRFAEPPPSPKACADDGDGRPSPQTLLGDIKRLDSAPMAALDLYLAELPPIAGQPFPDAHVSLTGSRYATTGFAASREWRPRYLEGGSDSVMPAGASVLVQFVCSDVTSLKGLEPDQAYTRLREDIARFIPELAIAPDGFGCPGDPVVEAVLLMNDGPLDELTVNNSGSLQHRPWAPVGLDNLWLAGDHCRSPVDVASMEAAVSSGLIAADAACGFEPTTDPLGIGAFRGAEPRSRWPESSGRRTWTSVIGAVSTVGAAVSFVLGFIGRLVMAPYRLARRAAVQSLYDDPLRRRERDEWMTLAGPAALVVGPLGVIAAMGANPVFDPADDPLSELVRKGAPGAWWLLGACLVNYVLLMVFAVPVRRFLPWSRQMTAGILMAAVGYLLFPVVRLGTPSGWWLPHTAVALLILIGPNWSVWAAASALRNVDPDPDPSMGPSPIALRRLAGWWRWLSVAVSVAVVVLSLFGVLQFWGQVAALLVGHFWILAVATHLLRSRRPAATALGRGPPDPCATAYRAHPARAV